MWRELGGGGLVWVQFGGRPGNFLLSNGQSWSSASSVVDPRCTTRRRLLSAGKKNWASVFFGSLVFCLKILPVGGSEQKY